MTANIETFARASGTQAAWHGLGGTFNHNDPIEVKAEKTGLNFTIESSPVIYRVGNEAKLDNTKKVFYRSDKPDSVVSVMSDQFKPVQPLEILEFYDRLQNELGIPLDTGGVLASGKYWGLAKNNGSLNINGDDQIDDYLLVATANDGSMATRIQPCRVRVVCQNTLTMAMRESSNAMSINHRQTVNWEAVSAYVKGEQSDFQQFGDIMQVLADIPVSGQQASEFATKLIAPEWDKKSKAPRKLTKFAGTMQSGIGQKEAGSTVYGLLNGVTRHVDHERQARTNDSRLNSAWFGQGNYLKNQALDMLIKDCVNQWGHKSALAPVLSNTRWEKLAA